MLATNGMIYFAPIKALQVFCIDPETLTAEVLGPELDGLDQYYAGGVSRRTT